MLYLSRRQRQVLKMLSAEGTGPDFCMTEERGKFGVTMMRALYWRKLVGGGFYGMGNRKEDRVWWATELGKAAVSEEKVS